MALGSANRVSVVPSSSTASCVSKVKVVVRLRPFLRDERNRESCKDDILRLNDHNTVELASHRNATDTHHYVFDACYGSTATQHDVFNGSVRHLIPHVLHGRNASVFAFGPTGSGKTYTMQGDEHAPGLILQTMQTLFRDISDVHNADLSAGAVKVCVSYLEIYNEKVYDLLSSNHGASNSSSSGFSSNSCSINSNTGVSERPDLPIREDQNRSIFIPGLTERPAADFASFGAIYEIGNRNRTTASTALNKQSSRSHTVLLVKVRRQTKDQELLGKFYLIDLAGSEDNRRTANAGVRMVESGAINKSLFVLGKVVDALNQGASRIPYRDSKLTRLLQDSLGGTANAVMVANVCPLPSFHHDTRSTLAFGSKTNTIVNTPFTHATTTAPTATSNTRAMELSAWKQQKQQRNVIDGNRERRSNNSSDGDHFNTKRSQPIRISNGKGSVKNSNVRRSNANSIVTKNSTTINSKTAMSSLINTQPAMTPCTTLKTAQTHIAAAKVRRIAGDDRGALRLMRQALLLVPDSSTLREKVARLALEVEVDEVDVAPSKQCKEDIPRGARRRLPLQDRDMNTNSSQRSIPSNPKKKRSVVIESDEEENDDMEYIHKPAGEVNDDTLDSDSNPEPPKKRTKKAKNTTVGAIHITAELRAKVECDILEIVNVGDLTALCCLGGIGEKRAQKILDQRNEHGPISELSSLRSWGFGDKLVEGMIKAKIQFVA